MYKIAVSLMRDYNIGIKNIMYINDENSIVDTDDERKEAIKYVTDEYKKMLGDMSKDPVLAYYALVAVYDKMYSRYQSLVERMFNSESDMIKNDAQTKSY